jgi:hypothetical protein
MRTAKGDWIPYVAGVISGGIGWVGIYLLGHVVARSASRNAWFLVIAVAMLIPGAATVFGREFLPTRNAGRVDVQGVISSLKGILRRGLLWFFGIATAGALGWWIAQSLR